MGFSDCQPISRGDAQCFVATTADLVLVCFQGTTSHGDWLSNLNVAATNTLYTYGQPFTGHDDFAAIMEVRLGDRYLRFVNDADVVPRVPPGYRHASRLVQFDAAGRLHTIISDHRITEYIRKI